MYQMFSNYMGLRGTNMNSERVQRIGQDQKGGRQRKIPKGTKVYIRQDFSESVQQKLKELWPKLRAARGRRKIQS